MRKGKQGTKLEDVVELSPSAPKLKDFDEVTFLGMADVSEDGRIIRNEAKRYTDVRNGFTPFKDSDVLVAKITPCFENGKGALVSNLINGVGFGSTEFHVLRPSAKIDPYYLLSITQSHPFRTLGESEMTGSAGQKRVPSDFIRGYKIYLPSIAEQKKIATILRTWDEAIEKLEHLILLNDQKLDHLIQSLIFGIVRVEQSIKNERIKDKWISGPKDWSLIKIGDIASEKSKLNSDGKNHVVLSCSKHDGFVRSLEYFKKQIFSKDLKSYKIIDRGDFGFPSNHVEEGSIGLQNLEDTAVVSPIYIIFTPDEQKIDSTFLFRLLKTRTYADIFRAFTSSSVDRRGNLRWYEFAKIPLFLPSLTEQKRITAILDTQQVLIEKLKQHKELLISQKRGLMQKLLTGEWLVTSCINEAV